MSNAHTRPVTFGSDELERFLRSEIVGGWEYIQRGPSWVYKREPLHGEERARVRTDALHLAFLHRMLIGPAAKRQFRW